MAAYLSHPRGPASLFFLPCGSAGSAFLLAASRLISWRRLLPLLLPHSPYRPPLRCSHCFFSVPPSLSLLLRSILFLFRHPSSPLVPAIPVVPSPIRPGSSPPSSPDCLLHVSLQSTCSSDRSASPSSVLLEEKKRKKQYNRLFSFSFPPLSRTSLLLTFRTP